MQDSMLLQRLREIAGDSQRVKPEHAFLPAEEFEAIQFSDLSPEDSRRLMDMRLELVAQRLKERCSHMPFYQEKEQRDPNCWRTLAASAVHAIY